MKKDIHFQKQDILFPFTTLSRVSTLEDSTSVSTYGTFFGDSAYFEISQNSEKVGDFTIGLSDNELDLTITGTTSPQMTKHVQIVQSVSGSVSGNDLTISVNGVNSDAIALPSGSGGVEKGTYSDVTTFKDIALSLNPGDMISIDCKATNSSSVSVECYAILIKHSDSYEYIASGYYSKSGIVYSVVKGEINSSNNSITFIDGEGLRAELITINSISGFYIKFT